MAQNLLTTNNIQPNPVLVNGTLITSGYISPNDFDFQVPLTLKAGAYLVQTYPNSTIRAQSNFGQQSFTGVTLFIGTEVSFMQDENDLHIQPPGIAWTPNRFYPDTSIPSFGGTTNIIHDGSQYRYAVVTGGLTATLLNSTDLITWTSRTLLSVSVTNVSSGTGNNLFYFSPLTNKYIFLTGIATANQQIRYSTDAITWSFATAPAITSGAGCRNMAFNNNVAEKLVTYDTVAATSQKILTSTDGITWSSRTSNLTVAICGVTTNGAASGEVYLVGANTAAGTANTIATSTDGITWTSRSTGISQGANGVTYINNLYCALYTSGAIRFVTTSTNGTTWTLNQLPFNLSLGTGSLPVGTANNIAFIGSAYSTNGTTWGSYNTATQNSSAWQIYVNGVYWSANNSNGQLSRAPFSTYYAIYEVDNQVATA